MRTTGMHTVGPRTAARAQAGVVLPITVILLVVIGLLGLSSMQMSRLQLRMSTNDEFRANAFQMSQALSDMVLATPAMTPLVGGIGYTLCTPVAVAALPACNGYTLDPAAVSPVPAEVQTAVNNGHLYGSARLVEPGAPGCPRGLCGSSVVHFEASLFEVRTTYDRTQTGLGNASTAQGLMILSPKTQ